MKLNTSEVKLLLQQQQQEQRVMQPGPKWRFSLIVIKSITFCVASLSLSHEMLSAKNVRDANEVLNAQ